MLLPLLLLLLLLLLLFLFSRNTSRVIGLELSKVDSTLTEFDVKMQAGRGRSTGLGWRAESPVYCCPELKLKQIQRFIDKRIRAVPGDMVYFR